MFNKIILLLLLILVVILLCDYKSENFAVTSSHNHLLGKSISFKFNPNADGIARPDICADYNNNLELSGEFKGTVFGVKNNRIIPRWDVFINHSGASRCNPLDNGSNIFLRNQQVYNDNYSWLKQYMGSYPGEIPSYFSGLVPDSFEIPKKFNTYVDLNVNGYPAKFKIIK